jgi:hypothetical protein
MKRSRVSKGLFAAVVPVVAVASLSIATPANAALFGIAVAASCQSPVNVGDPLQCEFRIDNSFQTSLNTVTIASLTVTVDASGGPATVSYPVNSSFGRLILTNGASCDATKCTIPFGATLTTPFLSHYTPVAADVPRLTGSGSFIWREVCDVVAAGCSTNPATVQTVFAADVQPVAPPSDSDGVPSAVEDAVPPPASCPTCVAGDGNGDGIPDSAQSDVTSLPSAGPGNPFVTLSSTATPGTSLADVQSIDPATLPPPPPGFALPVGVLTFTVQGVSVGGAADVAVYMPPGSNPTSYLKYDNGVWTNFTAHASFNGDVVTLHLVDGGAGDFDNTANGAIVDPGSPVVLADTVPPVVTGTPDRQPNSDGWYAAPVTITWSASDPAPSSGTPTTPAPTTATIEGHDVTYTSGPSCDAVNNCATGSLTLSIDTSDPVVVCGVTPTFAINQAGATVTASVSDAVSGPLASTVSQPVPTGTPGVGSVPVAGTDHAGRSTVVECPYRVTYVFSGFSAPVDNPPIVNTAKAGQTVPLRWRLTDANGVGVSDPSSFVSVTTGSHTCSSNDPTDAIETYTGSSGLQYLGNGYWQFNWATVRAYVGQCRVLYVNLGDGSTDHVAYFQFK